MKVCLSLPTIEIEEQEVSQPAVQFYINYFRFLHYTNENIDEPLHIAFQKVAHTFPNCTKLSLNWYFDDD